MCWGGDGCREKKNKNQGAGYKNEKRGLGKRKKNASITGYNALKVLLFGETIFFLNRPGHRIYLHLGKKNIKEGVGNDQNA